MSSQLLALLGLALATLLCAGITLFLYRRSPKTWYWLATATIGGLIAQVLDGELLRSSGSSQQLALILSLVLAALLYAVATLLYRRSGISTKTWYGFIGIGVAGLLLYALLGFFDPQTFGKFAPLVAYLGVIAVLWQRSRTR